MASSIDNLPNSQGSGPPMPNMAQIPLPPGMTLDMYMTLQGQLVTIAITVAVGLALIIWDYFTLIRAEFQLYTSNGKQVWRAPATWAFVVLRYSAFLATIPSLWFTSLQSQHCQVAVVASQVGALLVVASAGTIFCYRVIAIWDGSKPIYAMVTLAWAGMMGCWIAVGTKYRALTGPPTPFGSNCQMQPIVSWAPISFGSSVAFDVVILLLTLARIRADRILTSKIGRQIYHDSLVYFVATAVTNITVLSIQALGHEYDMIKPAAVPFSTVITVAMAERVFLNLKLYHQRQQHELSTLPRSNASGSSGQTPYVVGSPPPQQTFTTAMRPYSGEARSPLEAKSIVYPPRESIVYFSRDTVVT